MQHKLRSPAIAAFAAAPTGKNLRSHPVGEEPGLNSGVGAADGRDVKALDQNHLTYPPRRTAVLPTFAAAICLLLAAPAHAVQLPDGPEALADAARAAGQTLAGTAGPTPAGGGASAVSGAIDQGRAVQQTLSGTPAADGGQQNEPAPPSSGVAPERPGAQGEVEKALEGVLKSGEPVKEELASAGKDAAAAVKRAEAAAGTLLTTIPIVGPAVEHPGRHRARGARAHSAGVAQPRRAAGAPGTAAAGFASPSPVASRSQAGALAKRRSSAAEPAARTSSRGAAPRLETLRPAHTGPGSGAMAPAGLGFGAAAILLAAWLLGGAGLRTRIPSPATMSPALGFTSLLERPG